MRPSSLAKPANQRGWIKVADMRSVKIIIGGDSLYVFLEFAKRWDEAIERRTGAICDSVG